MRIAATIFIVAGLACVGRVGVLTISSDVSLGMWAIGLFAAALLYQGYALLTSKPHARVAGIAGSSMIAICAGVITYVLVEPWLRSSPYAVPADAWPLLAQPVVVTVAFAAAAIFLSRAKHAAP